MNHATHDTTTDATFSTDVAGLADATRPDVVELDDGDTYDLRIAPVAKNLGDDRVRMLAYNGSIPGPTLRVRQGSEVVVHVRNDGDIDATVHWHGLRLDNAYDGVPFETQPPIPIGGEFTYRLRFPDAGLYWYHPHVREDYGLDMGLYGNIVVEPADAATGRPSTVKSSSRSTTSSSKTAASPRSTRPARRTSPWAASATSCSPAARPTSRSRPQVGEVVRFYFTNTANTRLFNVAIPGARMKLVGSDSGRYEHETFVDEVLLAPSERAVVDVRFDTPGTTPIEHRTPDRTYIARHRRRHRHDHDVVERAGVRGAAHERRARRSWRARLDDARRTPTRQDTRVQVDACRSSTATPTPPRPPTSARCTPTSSRPSRERARSAA